MSSLFARLFVNVSAHWFLAVAIIIIVMLNRMCEAMDYANLVQDRSNEGLSGTW
jgi:hypothetical protein